jgi:hypothetical protein
MDDFNYFKNENQNFKYKWLLREKTQGCESYNPNQSQQSSSSSEKKVYIKPHQLPELNNDFNKKLVRFIENLIYSPYYFK